MPSLVLIITAALAIIIAFCVICAVLAFCIAPARSGRADLSSFECKLIAHRGLFDNDAIPENSIFAFERAAREGFGMELDIQLTKDGKVVVFHDDTTDRICGVEGKICEKTYEELLGLSLLSTDCMIPLFEDVLEAVEETDRKAPIIVEVKPEGDSIECVRKAVGILDRYDVIYCIESFDPRVLGWLRKHRPSIARGQLSTNYAADGLDAGGKWRGFALSNLLSNVVSRPDFVAYSIKHTNDFGFSACRSIFSPVCAAWTVRSEEDLAEARKDHSIIIFDSFLPGERTGCAGQ